MPNIAFFCFYFFLRLYVCIYLRASACMSRGRGEKKRGMDREGKDSQAYSPLSSEPNQRLHLATLRL